MAKYRIITYQSAKKFIDSLDKQRKARIDRIYYLFEEYGQSLPGKYLKKLTKNVWELRPGDTRLFLGINGNLGKVVHGVIKKSQKTCGYDLEIAEKRIKETKDYEK
jgi:phage-related protein